MRSFRSASSGYSSPFLVILKSADASLMDPSKLKLSTKWPRPNYYATEVRTDEKRGRKFVWTIAVKEFEEFETKIGVCSDIDPHQFFRWFQYIVMHRKKESNLMLQIKEAQRDDGELWAIVQNVEDGSWNEYLCLVRVATIIVAMLASRHTFSAFVW
ncbi:hypothetical protein Tco_0623794 [Tanacetum coccineum]|uniref:Uncharacterized protein n=1 Tax=Tanacetum coccineum TaxID=301880 RepID=A0ABQ4WC09_9ASTR